MKKHILILLSLSFLFQSCGMPTKSNLEFSDSQSAALDPDTQVTYAMLKDQILAPKCLSCHSDVGTDKGLSNSGWVTKGNPEGSPLFVKTENGTMPKGGSALPTRDLELIRMYITQLSASPSPSPSPSPTPSPNPGGNPGITYAEIKSRILQPYRCTSCHSVGTESSLSKWLNKTKPASSRLYTVTKSGSMPQGGSRVTTEDLAFILQYAKDFAAR